MSPDVQQLSQDATKAAAAPLWALSDHELTTMLHLAHRLEIAATTLQARLVHEAATRGLPTAHGHRNTTSWLRDQLRLDPQPARELTEHATTQARHPTLHQATLDGRLDLRQATAIAATITAIPTPSPTPPPVSPSASATPTGSSGRPKPP
jgi:hypothetical protein